MPCPSPSSGRSRLLRVLLAIAIVAALVVVFAGGSHRARTPQKLNGHQSQKQKVAKGTAATRDLRAIQSTRNPVFRSKVCDQLPEGYGHMGVCAAAPAYLHKSISPGSVVVGNLGIDTSHWDHCGSYLAGPRFWIVAVGDGTYVDPCAGSLYASLRAHGIPRSTYYFTRQYLSPIWSADHYAQLIRQMHATDSLVPWNDAEAITSCSWVSTFDGRLASDLGLNRVGDYSSPGLWSGCSGRGKPAWTAAYGPIGQRLAGGFSVYAMQQFTDGNVGPYPHCLAVCGDVDIATANLGLIAVNQAPPSPPIPLDFWQRCSRLDALTYWKLHGGHGHVSSAQHQQAVRIRKWITRNHIGCSAQPHSYPYRYPQRRGALA